MVFQASGIPLRQGKCRCAWHHYQRTFSSSSEGCVWDHTLLHLSSISMAVEKGDRGRLHRTLWLLLRFQRSHPHGGIAAICPGWGGRQLPRT